MTILSRRPILLAILLYEQFICINKNDDFVKETDTSGYIVVWAINTSHTD